MAKITVVGLGKLGSPLAVTYALSGHEVVGIDLSPSVVASINEGRAPVVEPGLQQGMDNSRSRLSASTDWSTALCDSEVSIVIVPTPSQGDGSFTNRYVLSAVRSIAEKIREGVTATPHTIVVSSTVMPGSMNGPIRSEIQDTLGHKLNAEIGLVYSPQFIALGSVMRNLQFPDMVLIGASDARAADHFEAIVRPSIRSDVSFEKMSLVNAEIVKLAVNTFVTTKISFANMLSEICDKLPGSNVDVVTSAIGKDSRIGSKYLSGGLGYGGPCFPRDNVALSTLAKSLGSNASIADATDEVNNRQVRRIVDAVKELANPGAVIQVWGASYKPDTDVIDASQGVMIAAELAQQGFSVSIVDPVVPESAVSSLSIDWVNPHEMVVADVVVIATPWPEFVTLALEFCPRLAIVDPWGLVSQADGVRMIRPGRGVDGNE